MVRAPDTQFRFLFVISLQTTTFSKPFYHTTVSTLHRMKIYCLLSTVVHIGAGEVLEEKLQKRRRCSYGWVAAGDLLWHTVLTPLTLYCSNKDRWDAYRTSVHVCFIWNIFSQCSLTILFLDFCNCNRKHNCPSRLLWGKTLLHYLMWLFTWSIFPLKSNLCYLCPFPCVVQLG